MPKKTILKGTVIRIDKMKDETTMLESFPDGIDHSARALTGKTGTVTHVDDAGQLWGTWGGLAVIPGEDEFTILSEPLPEPLPSDNT